MSKLAPYLAGLVVVLSAAIIVFVVLGNNRAKAYAAEIAALEDAADEAEQEAQADQDVLAEQLNAQSIELQSHQLDLIAMEKTMADSERLKVQLRNEIDERDEQLNALRLAHAQLIAARDALSHSAETTAKQLEEQTARVDAYQREHDILATTSLELSNALELAVAQRERYMQEVRLLNETLAAVTVERDELKEQLDIIRDIWPPDNDPPEAPDPDLPQHDGTITNVDEIGDGLTLVEIDLGTEDGLTIDRPFTIFRGDVYVGSMKITTLDEDCAVGEVTLLAQDIAVGDQVQTAR
ncbi:hypothetical protein OT109_14405 [Phycisphaeraceae bacterium D3-23]